MAAWFERTIIDTGRLPLFCFLVGLIAAFAFIRLSVRLIRAGVRWWPGNVTPGGLHIHHVVFGLIFMIVAGVAILAIPDDLLGWRSVLAALFGVGTALVLDEFALVLHLRDVYWSAQGRISVDAVFVAIAMTGLLLVGTRPIGVEDIEAARRDPGLADPVLWGTVVFGVNLLLAAVTLLKGKIWTGLFGLFVPLLIYVGAVRLARPDSPWARWRYRPGRRGATRKLAKARWRERRLRGPVDRATAWVQELIAGRYE